MRWWLVLLAAWCGAGPLAAAEFEFTFLAALHRVGLCDLAEQHAARLRRTGKREPLEEVDLLLEQIRSAALCAQSQTGETSQQSWERARSAAQIFLTEQPQHPRALLVRLQAGLTVLAQGEQQRLQASATADSAALAAAAATLRSAENMFEQLATEVDQLLPKRRAQGDVRGALSAADLTRLRLQLDDQRAASLWQCAFCHDAESPDRRALLLAILDVVEPAAARLERTDALAARLRVRQLATQRELGRHDDVASIWQLLDSDDTPPTLRQAGFAERVRSVATVASPAAALQLLSENAAAAWRQEPVPELELARLECVVKLARASSSAGPDAARNHTEEAIRLSRQLETQHGHYWGQRANELLASVALARHAQPETSVPLLTRQADHLYVRRELREARARYEQAAEQAKLAGLAEQARTLSYRAALITQELAEHASAATRLASLATTFPEADTAAQVHLAACWNMAQAVRTSPVQGPVYAQLLQTHIERWPAGRTAQQAQLWLAQWLLAQGSFREAFTHAQRVPSTAPEALAALRIAATASDQLVAAAQLEPPEREALARECLDYFLARLPQQKGVAEWGEGEQIAALAAATLQAASLPRSASQAEKLLTTARAAAPGATPEWLALVAEVELVALASQAGREQEALAKLQSSTWSPDRLQRLLALLERARRCDDEKAAERRLATVALAVLEQLLKESPPGSSAADRERWQQHRAALLALSGNRAAALAAYASLAERAPLDGDLQVAYATLLAAGTEKGELQQALARWRNIAARSPPREERWYRAKYEVATVQDRLGDRTAARTLVQYLLATPPGIPDPAWQRRFTLLLESLTAAQSP
jgi:hypothetical protein